MKSSGSSAVPSYGYEDNEERNFCSVRLRFPCIPVNERNLRFLIIGI
jgi:hypothetical protein